MRDWEWTLVSTKTINNRRRCAEEDVTAETDESPPKVVKMNCRRWFADWCVRCPAFYLCAHFNQSESSTSSRKTKISLLFHLTLLSHFLFNCLRVWATQKASAAVVVVFAAAAAASFVHTREPKPKSSGVGTPEPYSFPVVHYKPCQATAQVLTGAAAGAGAAGGRCPNPSVGKESVAQTLTSGPSGWWRWQWVQQKSRPKPNGNSWAGSGSGGGGGAFSRAG